MSHDHRRIAEDRQPCGGYWQRGGQSSTSIFIRMTCDLSALPMPKTAWKTRRGEVRREEERKG